MDDMSVDTATEIARRVAGYTGRLGLSGSGEPLLNASILEIIKVLSASVAKTCQFELLTNGDLLSVGLIQDLLCAGITKIVVSMHDGEEQYDRLQTMFSAANTTAFILREHWSELPTFNNRCGAAYEAVPESIDRACYFPFYKMRIHASGDVGLCCQDWAKSVIVGNVRSNTLEELWMSDTLTKFRGQLLKEDRRLPPCNTCDAHGGLSGRESFDLHKERIERE